ncbi:hypothetical protein QTP86_011310 [Hemibagrus guttatus]|nr:hypothetical protein QTP86_011310 [Hemibagrus guttatus]
MMKKKKKKEGSDVQEEEKVSRMKNCSQVLCDVNTEVSEAVHSLHWALVDHRGLVVPLLLRAEVHYQLLCLADVKEMVVPLAPVLKIPNLLQVDLLSEISPTSNVSSANLMTVVELVVATQSYVYNEYSRGLRTQPWGAPVLRVREAETCLPILTACGLPVRKFGGPLTLRWAESQATVPTCLKTITIIPVPGHSSAECLNGFRPAALIPIVMKCFEMLVLSHLIVCLPPTLDSHQFAYRPNRSTEDAISTAIHLALTDLDTNNTYIRMLFIDFSSAFNTVIPSKLITELSDLGVCTSLCSWIMDFLTNRPQSVRLGNHISSTLTLNTGVPQGCVLSPLLYSLFTHDCVPRHNIASNIFIKYADDTTVVGRISNNDESAYTEEIQSLSVWCSMNILTLNATKTKELIVDFHKSSSSRHSPIYINGSEVERVSSFKFLGVHISEDLSWHQNTSTLEGYLEAFSAQVMVAMEKITLLSVNGNDEKAKKNFKVCVMKDESFTHSFTVTENKGHASFTDTENKGHASFTETENKGHASFTETENKGHASFTETENKGHASFIETENKGHTSFTETENKGPDSFTETENKGHTSFTETENKGPDSFTETENKGHASFTETESKGHASFIETESKGHASFTETENKGPDSFTETENKGHAYLTVTQKKVHASFTGTENIGHASFTETENIGPGSFTVTENKGHAYLTVTQKKVHASFTETENIGHASFTETENKGHASFTETENKSHSSVTYKSCVHFRMNYTPVWRKAGVFEVDCVTACEAFTSSWLALPHQLKHCSQISSRCSVKSPGGVPTPGRHGDKEDRLKSDFARCSWKFKFLQENKEKLLRQRVFIAAITFGLLPVAQA